MTKLILLTILLFVVGLNYICVILAKSNPSIISGFKISDEPKQRTLDQAWLVKMFRYMHFANVLTLVGGIIGIVFDFQILFFLSLTIPYSLALFLGYIQRKDGNVKKRNMIAFIAALTIIVLTCLPVFYTFHSDLDVTISDNNISIKGLYGLEIPLQEIKEIDYCYSLPDISIRTNGFAMAKTRLGCFRTTAGESIMLFTYSDSFFT